VVPGDIGAQLAVELDTAVRSGELPPAVTELSAAGTWRPAPPEEGGGPGTYATSLPMLVARRLSREPEGQAARAVAARLARALEPVPWIAAARASGAGYLTVTVATGHLAGLPARIVAAGQQSVPPTMPMPDPAAAPDWPRAWNAQRDALVARLANAAAQSHPDHHSEHHDRIDRRSKAAAPPGHLPKSPDGGPSCDGRDRGPVATAVAWSGPDAVRYVLARTARPDPAGIERQLGLALDLDNPFVLVRYAHAYAASTRRWAADLARAEFGGAGAAHPEFAAAEPTGSEPAHAEFGEADPIGAEPSPGPEPAELALIDLLSWYSERRAAAARRRRPAELCQYLEQVAGAYLYCAQTCPALPSGGAAAPLDLAGPQAAARRTLADAARRVLGAGLMLAGVSAPAEVFGL
jgi:arginyl-tRNA synthetase